jgi:predicted DNA-binding transcriptional regulator YafY
MDRLQAMKVFTRVVETNSFLRAADARDLPRAWVTVIIQQLEAHLKVCLLQRATRRLNLTHDNWPADKYSFNLNTVQTWPTRGTQTAFLRSAPVGDSIREAVFVSRSSRLLNLLQVLRGKSRAVTAAALAADLGVSERTLYRDIAELSAQGAPIYGEAGVGYVLRPGLFLPPLMLTEDEVEAIVLGLRYVDQRGDQTLGEAAADALAKIAAVLPPAALEALRNPVALPGPSGGVFPSNVVEIASLRNAIRSQATLHIHYEDANGAGSERVVWPIALGFMNEARVLVAWCETRQAYRTFRTDRIASAAQTGRHYPGTRGNLLKAWRKQMGVDEAGKFMSDRS